MNPDIKPLHTQLPIAILEHLSTLPLFVCAANEGFRFIYANESALQLFGYTLAEIMALGPASSPGYPLVNMEEHWNKLPVDQTAHADTLLQTHNGSRHTIKVSYCRYQHEGQSLLIGHCTNQQHITELEQQLFVAERTAEQALSVRNRFLTHMSHELRTPLGGIIGLSLLARDTESLSLARDYFKQIHQSGEQLLSTLTDILDFCQLETGIMALHPISFNPANLIEEAFNAVKNQARSRNIQLNGHIDPDLPAYLVGDAQRLRQVLMNLVDNAVKFTKKGAVSIRIEKSPQHTDDSIRLRISVSDTGQGIAVEDCPKLFKAFEQLDSSDNRRHQGSGLGLALAWHLVKLMGGAGIDLDSDLGLGSTFSLELPFDMASASVLQQHNIEVIKELPLCGLNILIVEDNAINHRIARAMMEKSGSTVTVAENGAVAVDLLRRSPPNAFDLILMDIQMPVMDGYTATRLIRHDLHLTRIPIIATTAHTMSIDRQACLEAGMDAHVGKPINKQLLINTILNCLPRNSEILVDMSSTNGHSLQLVALVNMNRNFKESIPNLPNALLCLGNDEHLYCELGHLFISQHAEDMKELEHCLKTNKTAQARMITHTLKDLANTMGLIPLHEAMTKLHYALQSHPEEWPANELEMAETELQTTLKALRQLLLGLPL
ncbi:MAG: ATP-binding protein [Methylococcaceae bacterium]